MGNAINWFEIPVKDFERAKVFYETVMEWTINESISGDCRMGLFPNETGKVSGAIVAGPRHTPSPNGTIVYLNCNPNMDPYLARVEAAGGTITVPKNEIAPEMGYWACVTDTEGNRIGFLSQK